VSSTSQAAKNGDVVIGVDIHMVMVPTPVLVPTPLPHPFVGVVWDPLGASIAGAISQIFGGGGPVVINGMLAGNTGTHVKGAHHITTPPGTTFAPNDIPGNDGSIVSGSKTVHLAGSSAGRLGSLVSSCNFPLNLPTSTCLAVAMGDPVIVGGPEAMDWQAAITHGIRTKWCSDQLFKLFGSGKWVSKIICFLTGHPVDVVSGQLLTDAVDFELPGPIPIVFERNYYSRSRYEGPLGPAWHHPLDASVNEERRRTVVRLPDGRESPHDPLTVGESVWEPIDRYTLMRTKNGYRLTFWDGLAYHFAPVEGAHVTHALVKITDRCDNAVELRHEGGRLVTVIDSIGRELRFRYAGGRLRLVRLLCRDGELMDLIRYDYDADGRLVAAIDPEGGALRYEYKRGMMVKETKKSGLSFYFAFDWYDPDGMCVRTWGDGGIYERKITYDEANHFTVVDDGRGGRTHYWGNPGGLVDRMLDPTGVETKYEWHPKQYRKTAEIDGMGHRQEWAYDDRGNLVRERDALGHETRWSYNELNVPMERTDAAGGVWRRDYDGRGKLVRAINPLGDVTRCKHDRRGNLVSIEDPKGRKTALRYTSAGELCEVVDAERNATAIERDDRGLVVRRRDAIGGETRIQRDACGRPVTVRRPDGSIVRMRYDAEGNVTDHLDALGNVTRCRYAGMDKLVERMDPAGGVVKYLYDVEESLVCVINEAEERYEIEVDKAGRVVKERGFDGRKLELWYDRAGRCREMVDAHMKRTRIERDATGRVVKQVVPRKPLLGDPLPEGEGYEYAYDPLGRLVRAKNDATEVTFTRDALGRVVEEKTNGIAVASKYDAAGDRVGRKTSLGHETGYDFDANGDLVGVAFGAGALWGSFDDLVPGAATRAPWRATFARDAVGNETERSLPGGLRSRWDRDVSGRPRVHRILHAGLQVSAVGYKWRSAEQLAGLIDTQAGATWFDHDVRGYLVAATRPDGSTEVRAPDVVGNLYRTRERTDREYLPGGRLKEANGTQYVHDEDGRLVEKVTTDGKRWAYAWDFAGQLVEVTRPDGQRVSFAYDALGRRVRKTFAGKTTRFVWDGNDLVHELAEGAEAVTWVFEPGMFAPLAKMEGEKRYSVVTDHLGTPKMMADEAGALAWKGQLDVYGVARNDVALTGCPWRWPGQYEDAETGLFYNRFRYYDPETGRYVCQDPIGLAGGLALYGYVVDPFVWIDAFGLSCGRSGAFNEAKRDAGVPRGAEPEGLLPDVMTDRTGKQILGPDGLPITTRQYKFTNANGQTVWIQDHSAGHQFGEGGVGDQGPHFNVRPDDGTGVPARNGTVPGTKAHYPFDT
jgi:RHS repeat-associated protein